MRPFLIALPEAPAKKHSPCTININLRINYIPALNFKTCTFLLILHFCGD